MSSYILIVIYNLNCIMNLTTNQPITALERVQMAATVEMEELFRYGWTKTSRIFSSLFIGMFQVVQVGKQDVTVSQVKVDLVGKEELDIDGELETVAYFQIFSDVLLREERVGYRYYCTSNCVGTTAVPSSPSTALTRVDGNLRSGTWV